MSRATSTGLALALALSVFLVDQVSKRLIQGSLRPGESIPAIPDVLRISYTRNDGGAFGVLGGQSGLLLIGSAVAVAFVLMGDIANNALSSRWLALRLLDGDKSFLDSLSSYLGVDQCWEGLKCAQ